MKPASDAWTRALETWQGMVPPLLDPTVVAPGLAAGMVLDLQRAALAGFGQSCSQANELRAMALGWSSRSAGREGEQGGGSTR